LAAKVDFDPYTIADFHRIVAAWLPFVFAMNSLSRAIGSKDLYRSCSHRKQSRSSSSFTGWFKNKVSGASRSFVATSS
jgi:Putative zinc-binding metallo-peptidase